MTQFRMLLIFTACLFLAGIVFGSIVVLFMPMEQKIDIMNKMTLLFENRINNEWITDSNIVWQNAQSYIWLSLIIFVLGLSVIGMPVVLLFVFVKGAIVGFTTSFIVSELGTRGILFVFYSVIPQNLIIVPVLIFYSASSLALALFIINNRILKYNGRLRTHLISFVTISMAMSVLLVAASMYESFLAPYLMDRAIILLPKSLLLFDLYSLSLL